MKRLKCDSTAWFGALAVAALILDSKTATQAGFDALQLCYRVLIPSLFPFFVFSPMMAGGNFGRVLRPLARLLRLPDGAESILLVSFLGGYPVGASVTAQYCRSGMLTKEDGRRMMAFCSNAGPSFLFGVGAQIFPSVWYCWTLWLIHILSAILVGTMTQGGSRYVIRNTNRNIAMIDAVKNGIQVMANVCGWVMIFRILLRFCDRWFLWLFPKPISIFFSGLLELANGCASITALSQIGMRMVFFSAIIGFGGCCVWLQTKSVSEGVDISAYLPGKLTQAAISTLLTTFAQPALPQPDRFYPPRWIIVICCLMIAGYGIFQQKKKNKAGNPTLIGV